MSRQPILSHKLAKELSKETLRCAGSSNRHDWIKLHTLAPQLRKNLQLMQAIRVMCGKDLRQANYLFNYCLNHIHQAVPLIQEQMKKNSEPMLDPTHPLVMNNINHPLNPSNPNNIMLNPGGNIMVQQAEAEEASVNEAQEEENAENHLHEILSTSLVTGAAAQAREELKDDFDPHKFLNVTPETEQSEIAAAAYDAMAKHMPHDEHQKPSPEFKMATLAAGLIGTHKLHEEFKLGHKHGLEKSAEDHGVMSIPKFTPIK